MRHLFYSGLGLAFLLAGVSHAQDASTEVPLGGNAFVTRTSPVADELIDDTGLHNWDSKQAVTSVYFDVKQPGQIDLSLVGSLGGASHSTVMVSIGRQSHLVTLSSTAPGPFPAGTFTVSKPGYVKVDLQGVRTDGGYYGDISGLKVSGSATAGGLTFANDPANFYWSRRGPSVHLGFDVPDNTEYFYSEVTVPKSQDPIGSYFMANGFSVGYFGIQVNSATERRVLFSVWDASDGGATTLVKKGPDVVTNGFGGEGTGGQSYLVFNWKAGQTYRFITRAQPDGQGNTVFSAWFGTPCPLNLGQCQWKFIASWKHPAPVNSLKGVYSFLENFDDSQGYVGRSALYGNEWAITADGKWNEMKSAYFDVDPTGLNKQRLDFSGGKLGPVFYLRNDGFFSNSTTSGTTFDRSKAWFKPHVDLGKLP